jgi:hypothetical protein
MEFVDKKGVTPSQSLWRGKRGCHRNEEVKYIVCSRGDMHNSLKDNIGARSVKLSARAR